MGEGDSKIILNTTTCEKDLGVYIDPLLNFDQHITNTVNKARGTSFLLSKNITYKAAVVMVPLFKSLVRPILEYANAVWSPHLRKHVDAIEDIQRKFTKHIIGMKDLSYEQRLSILKLPSLEFRRIRGDLIEVYKIMHKIYDPITTKGLLPLAPEDNKTRGNKFKILKQRTNTNNLKYFFTNRFVNLWNSLTDNIVDACSINSFKKKIDFHFKNIMYQTNINLHQPI